MASEIRNPKASLHKYLYSIFIPYNSCFVFPWQSGNGNLYNGHQTFHKLLCPPSYLVTYHLSLLCSSSMPSNILSNINRFPGYSTPATLLWELPFLTRKGRAPACGGAIFFWVVWGWGKIFLGVKHRASSNTSCIMIMWQNATWVTHLQAKHLVTWS